jgi:hypothetical protein
VTLAPVPGHFAVARLAPDAPFPSWATGALVSLTRSADELSIVCDDAAVPTGIPALRDLAALRVVGTIDPAAVGILAALTGALAAAAISVFAFSTFDTDYLLLARADLDRALAALATVATVTPAAR